MTALEVLNDARLAAGVPVLVEEIALVEEAWRRAAQLVSYGQLTHAGAETAEVLAWGQLSEQAVIREWLGSPPHRAVLLAPDYRAAGLVDLQTDPQQRLWVGVFV